MSIGLLLSGHGDTTSLDPPIEVRIVGDKGPPTYSSQRRDDFRQVRQVTKEDFNIPRVADLDSRVNIIAQRFKDANDGRWPSAFELLNYDPYQNSIQVYLSGWSGLPRVVGFRGEDGGTQWAINDPIDGPRLPSIGSLLKGTGGFGNLEDKFIEDLPAVLASLSPIRQPTAGSGSRGAGRAPIVFDENQLADEANERWRGLLLETPDDSELDRLVQDYINDARAFWMKEGGRRDFDTFVVDRIRTTARHSFLYDRKPDFQSEAEYLGGFRQVAGGLGLNASATLREVEAGASTGVGLAGFGERLSGIREVRTANAGAFSQRIAASAGQMGLTRT